MIKIILKESLKWLTDKREPCIDMNIQRKIYTVD